MEIKKVVSIFCSCEKTSYKIGVYLLVSQKKTGKVSINDLFLNVFFYVSVKTSMLVFFL